VVAVYAVHGNVATPSEFAAGPWDPTFQHGGAPAALLARAAERACSDGDGQVVRLSVELMRPVPLLPLTVSAVPIRQGRKLRVVEARLEHKETPVARATAIWLRTAAIDPPRDQFSERDRCPPGPETGKPPPSHIAAISPFFLGIETRVVAGNFDEPGPATAWFRLRRAIVAGEEPTALMRVIAVADFANGLSSVLDLDRWTFANADLTMSSHRQAVGEWVCLESQMSVSDSGVGCTHTVLFDTMGRLGWSSQSLLIEERS
jgi:hypothetical protein